MHTARLPASPGAPASGRAGPGPRRTTGARPSKTCGAALFLALACACVSSDAALRRKVAREVAPAPSAGEPVAKTLQDVHPGSDVVRSSRRVLVHPDGRSERHGEESEWYADGTPRSRRWFEHDRPTGLWSRWYEDGSLRSEIDFGDGVAPALMRFWHPNGTLASEGLGIGGLREGLWTHWNEAGVPSSEGTYLASLRDGPWTFWHASGPKRAEGRYSKGQRVGEWRLWDEQGTLVVRQVSASERPDPELDAP